MSRLHFLILLIFLLFITLPYIQAGQASGPAYVFGGFFLNPIDGNTYLAKMRQGWDGAWQFKLPYTADPGEGSYLFLFYLFLGHAARWLGLPLLLSFHLARVLAALVLLLALDRFYHALFPAGGPALLAFALAALGSGMGWLAALAHWVPADLWVAEAYPFLASFSNPHFPLSLAIMVWLLKPTADHRRPTSESDRTPQISNGRSGLERSDVFHLPFPNTHFQSGLRSAAGGLLLSLLSPFGVIVVGLVMAGQIAWQGLARQTVTEKEQRRTFSWINLRETILKRAPQLEPDSLYSVIGLALGAAPMLIYAFWIARVHPALAGWNAQNITPTPPAWDIFLSLSPALLFAVVEIWSGRREALRSLHAPTLVLWTVVGLVLIFLPVSLQLRFTIGLFIPIAGLAAAGLERLARGAPRLRRSLVAALFLLSLPGLLFIQLAAAFSIQSHSSAVFLSGSEAQALRWIEEHTAPSALILAAPDTGLFIPAHTSRRVIYGHPFETVNATEEEAAVENFFRPAPWRDADRQEFLKQRRIDYIFAGPREKALGEPSILQDLRQVYASAGVEIYAAR
jgi:hypothetical protein